MAPARYVVCTALFQIAPVLKSECHLCHRISSSCRCIIHHVCAVGWVVALSGNLAPGRRRFQRRRTMGDVPLPEGEGGRDAEVAAGPPPAILGPNAAIIGYLTPGDGGLPGLLHVSRESLLGDGMSIDTTVRNIFSQMLGLDAWQHSRRTALHNDNDNAAESSMQHARSMCNHEPGVMMMQPVANASWSMLRAVVF